MISPSGLAPNQFTSTGPNTPTSKQSPSDQFGGFRQILADRYLEWTELPEEEQIRHKYLEAHGLSEQDLHNLSPEDKAAHEQKIAEILKQPGISNSVNADVSSSNLLKPVVTLQAVLELNRSSEHTAASNPLTQP